MIWFLFTGISYQYGNIKVWNLCNLKSLRNNQNGITYNKTYYNDKVAFLAIGTQNGQTQLPQQSLKYKLLIRNPDLIKDYQLLD